MANPRATVVLVPGNRGFVAGRSQRPEHQGSENQKADLFQGVVVGRRGIEPRTLGLKARFRNEQYQWVTGFLWHQAFQGFRRERRYPLAFPAGGTWVFTSPPLGAFARLCLARANEARASGLSKPQ